MVGEEKAQARTWEIRIIAAAVERPDSCLRGPPSVHFAAGGEQKDQPLAMCIIAEDAKEQVWQMHLRLPHLRVEAAVLWQMHLRVEEGSRLGFSQAKRQRATGTHTVRAGCSSMEPRSVVSRNLYC
eukprot:GFYU01017645.1.p2 GENE.GFYU01017645.1~~GFYU01017645.1.p2  ORF type:complete len:126 (-),score=3.00 GFYU01017645.1:612-989(-)